MYFMTFLLVGLVFKAGPDWEAKISPVLTNTSITEQYRMNDKVCYKWVFTKLKDVPAIHISFNITDSDGVIYDAETTDIKTGDPISFHPQKTKYLPDIEYTRYLCTTLPNIEGPLTLQGKFVYNNIINLWQVTHYTQTITVPKGG